MDGGSLLDHKHDPLEKLELRVDDVREECDEETYDNVEGIDDMLSLVVDEDVMGSLVSGSLDLLVSGLSWVFDSASLLIVD